MKALDVLSDGKTVSVKTVNGYTSATLGELANVILDGFYVHMHLKDGRCATFEIETANDFILGQIAGVKLLLALNQQDRLTPCNDEQLQSLREMGLKI